MKATTFVILLALSIQQKRIFIVKTSQLSGIPAIQCIEALLEVLLGE
jgi:hypothetical protein